MASMDVTCTDGWLLLQCQGTQEVVCGQRYIAPAAVPDSMAAAVRAAAAHVCGQPDDVRSLLQQASSELIPATDPDDVPARWITPPVLRVPRELLQDRMDLGSAIADQLRDQYRDATIEDAR